MLSVEWFTAGELAAMRLPGLGATERAVQLLADRETWRRPEWEGLCWRRREASGGGAEYHYSVLPEEPKTALVLRLGQVEHEDERAKAKAKLSREEMWAWFERLPEKKREEARRRLKVLDDVEDLRRAGHPKTIAAMEVAARAKVTTASLYNWASMVRGVERHDWLPHLAPRHAGRAAAVECSREAWEFFKADFLRPEKPNLVDCYRRLQEAAKAHGWTIPSQKTLARRIEALAPQVRVLAREGADALKRLYPAQQRDRGVFHALEAVNADGHKWDVFVRWPDGTIGRPVMIAFQDLYSGLILSWRVDRTENQEAVRLAFGDLVETWGIPDHCWLDNGRNFASKWLTGGTPTRFRFKVREDEPAGVMTQLGVQVHWTTPYSGQSKPIERAFRDLAQGLAKHPAFAGAYVGNNPMAKPENYGSKAVALETFLEVLAGGIQEHNTRVGRQSRVCGGTLSFRQAFDASYAQAAIRKATAEQRRLWLMAAEQIRVRQTGQLEILGNTYWSDDLHRMRGQLVTVRFDPQALHEPLHVYRQDGGYLGAAECVAAAGFADVGAARDHGRRRRAWLRAQRDILAAERSMSIADVAALLPKIEAPEPPAPPKIVRLVQGATALAAIPEPEEDAPAVDHGWLLRDAERNRRLRAERGHLNLVLADEEDDAGA